MDWVGTLCFVLLPEPVLLVLLCLEGLRGPIVPVLLDLLCLDGLGELTEHSRVCVSPASVCNVCVCMLPMLMLRFGLDFECSAKNISCSLVGMDEA